MQLTIHKNIQKIIFFLFCLSANAAFAQVQGYEFTAIVPLDAFSVKKSEKTDTVQSLHTVFFADLGALQHNALPFYTALKNRKTLNWFADKNCTKAIKPDFKLCDTLLKDGKFFSTSCSEQISSECVVAYALRHFVTYNATTQKMNVEVFAIAPIITRYNTKGQQYQQTLGWVKRSDANNVAENQNFAFGKRATLFIKNSDIKTAVPSAILLPQTLFEAAKVQKFKIL